MPMADRPARFMPGKRAIARALSLIAALLVVLVLLAWGVLKLSGSKSHQLVGELLTRVETGDPVVALTFDDGPVRAYTDSVLDVLDRFGARATFFMIGRSIEARPGIARRVLERGHELGNHSWSHDRMILVAPSTIRREVDSTDALIRAAGQTGPIHMRPPYGKRLIGLPLYLSRQNRPVVLWDLDPDTHHSDADWVTRYVLDNVRPGSIILLHVEIPSRRANREALPRILEELSARGYRFVTLSELIEGDTAGG
jgi:peptidoglycan/xylan/chitin deacetylase (PgdA/CDA1 family)